MKTKLIIAFATVMTVMFGSLIGNAQVPSEPLMNTTPGIAVAGSADASQLPDKAKHFIAKHFKNISIKKCEKFYAKGEYEVELTNGVDIEFNLDGVVTEIDAPGKTYLPVTVVKEILPHKAFSRLEKAGLSGTVESIEFKKGRAYEVELNIPDPDTYIFDVNGEFIAIED
ncbi:MAG: PepSY-like domain-containing protein [Muribaculum sp.]|nr:PepSY-like domain-containing protein [Muribaculum sp.]